MTPPPAALVLPERCRPDSRGRVPWRTVLWRTVLWGTVPWWVVLRRRVPTLRRLPAGDAGVAAPLVLGLAGLLATLAALAAALGGVAVARQRAASAADLAALAAAEHLLSGGSSACARADEVAARVRARVVACRVEGQAVRVVAQVRPPGPLGRLGTASAQARAGPAPPGQAHLGGGPTGHDR